MAWAAVVPLAIAGISALTKGISAMKQRKNAKDMQANNIRPDFDIQEEYLRNQRMAQSLAQQGLTQEAKDYYNSQADQAFAGGTNAILSGGGDINQIAGLYNNYLEGQQKLAAADSEAQTKNIINAMTANEAVAGQKAMQWSLNKYEPYKDTAKAVAAERAASMQNMNSALSDVLSGASSYATMSLYEKDLDLRKKALDKGEELPAPSYQVPLVPLNQNTNYTPQGQPIIDTTQALGGDNKNYIDVNRSPYLQTMEARPSMYNYGVNPLRTLPNNPMPNMDSATADEITRYLMYLKRT